MSQEREEVVMAVEGDSKEQEQEVSIYQRTRIKAVNTFQSIIDIIFFYDFPL